jgi:thioredoxin-related protein
MYLSMIVAALALQAPTPKPAPKPTPKPAPAPTAPAPKAEAPKAEAATTERWIADFDQAAQIAKKEGKDLLVDFTGSDWCGWCIKLHKEVFDFDSFLDAAEKSYVLVALDYPHDEAVKKKVPNPTRNAELAKKYKIGGFPTILLMTADGDVFGRTGYQEGGPDKYVESVKTLTADGKKELAELNAFAAKFNAAKPADQPKLLDEAIAKLTGLKEDSPFGAKVAALVATAIKVDPDNKQGIAIKAIEALLKAGQADDAVNAAAKTLDAKNEKGLLERVVSAQVNTIQSKEQIEPFLKAVDDLLAAGAIKDAKVGKQLLANAAFMSKQHLNDAARAKGYATKLKALGLDGPDDENLKKFVDSILTGTG